MRTLAITLLIFMMTAHPRAVLPVSSMSQQDIKAVVDQLGGKGSFAWATKNSPLGKDTPALMVFVSASMPKPLLQTLLLEAKKYGGRVLMRGFIKGSYLKTAQFFKELIQKIGVGIEINPKAFEEFKVKMVPTFVVAVNSIHDKLEGATSLRFALEEMSQRGETSIAAKKILGTT